MDQHPERWRQWLENAAVPAPASPDARRRTLRRRASSTDSTPTRTASRTGPSPKVLVGGAGAIAVVTAVCALVGMTQRSTGPASSHPYKVVTTAAAPSPAQPSSTASAAPAFCTPGRVGAALVSNTGGDRVTGEGAIAEYEYRYFARRDPAAVMEVTDSGPGVPSPAQVADGIASIPADAPWCVSVTPVGPDRFETSVRYQAAVPVAWLMVITVAPGEGGYRVVRIEDKPA